jgi:hypothetical protein
MAQYDLTPTLTRVIAAGGTREQLLAAHDRIITIAGNPVACNRAAQSAANDLASTLEQTRAAETKKAATQQETAARKQEMHEQVRAGKTLFTNIQGQWLVVGPLADLRTYSPVTVTKRDGTTETVRVGRVLRSFPDAAVPYSVAEFTRVRAERPMHDSDRPSGGRCASCSRYSDELTSVPDGSGILGRVCSRCADHDPMEHCFG